MNRLPGPKDLIKYIPAFIIIGALFIFLLALVNYAGNDGLKREISNLKLDKTINLATQDEVSVELVHLNGLNDSLTKATQGYYQAARALEEEVIQGKSPYRIAYLTFDDGPFLKTQDYLEVLNRYDVLGTFFVLGKTDYIETYRDIVGQGHTLGNHTYSHKIWEGLYDNPASFMTDVDKLDLFLQENIGLRSRVFRFPGGSLAAGEIREECISALHESGYKYVDWNALTRDAEVKGLTLEGAYENLMPLATSKSMAVILMHDFNSASLGALPTIIEDLQAQNYVLLPLFDNSLVLK